MYFVITNHDGEAKISRFSKGALLEKLNQKYWGDLDFKNVHWLDDHGLEMLDGAILIKGDIVVPQAKETVVEFDVP